MKRVSNRTAPTPSKRENAQPAVASMSVVPIKPPRRDPRRGRIYWFQLWIAEYRNTISNLSTTVVGAHWLLFLELVSRQEPLPDDEALLRRITRTTVLEWPAVRAELEDVMRFENGTVSDDAVDKIVQDFRDRSARNKRNRDGRNSADFARDLHEATP